MTTVALPVIRRGAPPVGAFFLIDRDARDALQQAFRTGGAPSPAALTAAYDTWLAGTAATTVRDGVATIPVKGILTRGFSWWNYYHGASCYEAIALDLEVALADATIHSIIFNVASPGGELGGVAELAGRVFAARERKSIVAHVDGSATSAAYWIAAAASRVSVAPTAMVGGLGISMRAEDWSGYDAARGVRQIDIVSTQSPAKNRSPFEPDGRAQLQAHADALAEVFLADVATFRGVTLEQVRRDFGAGDVAVGERAVQAGLADIVSTEVELRATLQQENLARVKAAAATKAQDRARVAAPAAQVTASKRGENLHLSASATKGAAAAPARPLGRRPPPLTEAQKEARLVASIRTLVQQYAPRR